MSDVFVFLSVVMNLFMGLILIIIYISSDNDLHLKKVRFNVFDVFVFLSVVMNLFMGLMSNYYIYK